MITATMIAGTMKTPKIATVAYARRAMKAAITSATPAVADGRHDGGAEDRRPPSGLVAERAEHVRREQHRPDREDDVGHEEHDQDRHGQGRQLGQRVVARSSAREKYRLSTR